MTLRVGRTQLVSRSFLKKGDNSMSVLSFRPYKGDAMKESKVEVRDKEKKPRSVVLPAYIWEALEKDAERCHRTVTKQIEAIFSRYYKLDANVELDEETLAETYDAVSRRRTNAA